MQSSKSTAAPTAAGATPPAISESLYHFDRLPDSANVRVRTVAALIDASTATVWRRTRQGELPRPRKFGPKITAWNVGELRRALAAQAA